MNAFECWLHGWIVKALNEDDGICRSRGRNDRDVRWPGRDVIARARDTW